MTITTDTEVGAFERDFMGIWERNVSPIWTYRVKLGLIFTRYPHTIGNEVIDR
jgi:hypothetical protein